MSAVTTPAALKKPYILLDAAIRACPIPRHAIVRHHSGDRYRILDITVDCKTNELRLTYTKIGVEDYGTVRFSRPADDFVEPRFVVEGSGA